MKFSEAQEINKGLFMILHLFKIYDIFMIFFIDYFLIYKF